MSKWWQNDMSDASQGLFSDPNLALQIATLPAQTLAAQQQSEEEARVKKGGFLKQTMSLMGSVGKGVDGALSKVPGWGLTKDAGKALWYPVDKAASGAYWLYSNGVSQPLSTGLLMAATSQWGGIGTTSYLSPKDWADTWHKANKISPGQAAINYENTVSATGEGSLFGPLLGRTGANLSQADKDQVKRQTARFVYDTDYWKNKGGFQYTVGTGAIDFMASMGLDPLIAATKVLSPVAKGARAIKVAGQTEKASKSVSGLNILADKAGQKLAAGFVKTPEEASQSRKVQDFFEWTREASATGAARKSPFEIQQHPIWGRGRRVNPAREQLSQILSQADEVEQPMILRMAMGDNDVIPELVAKNSDLVAQIGKMSDNRKLVDSVKYSPTVLKYFAEDVAGGAKPGTIRKLGNQLVEPPYPRPTTPGPRQAGWDATYGKLQGQADLYRQAAKSIQSGKNGVRGIGASAKPAVMDGKKFNAWKKDQLDLVDQQHDALKLKGGYYAEILGDDAAKSADDFRPGQSNAFGTLGSLYRSGPLAFRDASAAADKTISAKTVDRIGRKTDGGFASRVIRSGYYSIPLKIVQSFGDRLPNTLINHNDADSADRVLDMLKRVPGLGQDVRLGMVNEYSAAGDKIAKSSVLQSINKNVITHMAANHNLDEGTARIVAQMIKDGTDDAMQQLSGRSSQTSQAFSAAKNTLTKRRADKFEDGEGIITTPLAKTQLAYSEALLDVKELDRFLSRNSGYLRTLKSAGGRAFDGVTDVADSLSNMWKAATLLRPGYILRAPSEEMAASAIKFGLISSIADTVHGGGNWVRNRTSQVKAVIGEGSYGSTVGGKARVRVLDPDVADAALNRGDKITNIDVGKAWPIVMARIDDERAALKPVLSKIEKESKKKNPNATKLADLEDQAADHRRVIDEHGDYADAILQEAKDNTGRRLGEGTITHRGIEVPQAFSKAWENPIPREQITSAHAMEAMFARGEAIDTSRMIKTGSWVGVTPRDPNHMSSWLDAVNKQFRQDDLFKLVAGDPTLKTARDWLKTAAGRQHLAQLGKPGSEPTTLLRGIADTLDQYLPVPALRDKMARGEEVTETELRKGIAKEDFPVVHGEEVKGLTADGHMSTASAAIDGLINKGFKRLSAIPTDILSRQPTYLRAQEARMRTLIDQELSYQKSVGKAGDSIDAETLNAMLKKSDGLARKDISQLVYDPKRTTATQALRFVTPFLSAHVDGLERWAGLIAEQPQLVGQASKIYNAPVAANLVTDANGNHVDQNGYATITDPDGKVVGRKFIPLSERVLHLKTPPGTRGIVGALTGTNGKEVPIKIQALNTIAPGDPWWNPGSGPYVQMAASKLALKDPAMGDFLQWAKVLPYGPSEGGLGKQFMDAFTPKYVSEAFTAFHTDDTKFQQTMLQEYQRQVADHANGGPAPDMRLAEKNAKKFYYLKALTSWLTPAQTQTTPLTGTPYQFYTDQFKKMQQVDPKTADDQFLAKYGEDYFAFTASLSKSMGIAPTISALNTAKEYKDLIAGDSSLASFIVGDVYNQGDFSSSAYAAEKGMSIGGEKVRSSQSVQDALVQNQVNLGWAQYNKLMNSLDASLIRTGFKSYTEKGAANFLQIKQSIQAYLKQQYPSWEEDFDTTDRGLVARRIDSFKHLVNDPKLANDPMRSDIPVLSLYLQGRDMFKQQLATQGASQLSFGVNGDPQGPNAGLANSWRAFQTGLVASNTKFADVFNRYLSNDDLQ